jgi:hypothetical protein
LRIFTCSILAGLEPRPNMSIWPWLSVAASIVPSGDHLASNTAPWPWFSMLFWNEAIIVPDFTFHSRIIPSWPALMNICGHATTMTAVREVSNRD